MADVQRTINAIEDYIGGNVEGIETVDRMGLTVFLRSELERFAARVLAEALGDLTSDLIAILGRPCFHCGGIAEELRTQMDIPHKAENEQAAVAYYLLKHYLADKEKWAEKAAAELSQMRKQITAAVKVQP